MNLEKNLQPTVHKMIENRKKAQKESDRILLQNDRIGKSVDV